MSWQELLALLLVALTIVAVAVGRIPFLRVDRATIVLLGMAGLFACGAIHLEEAYELIDFDTILLLFSMMVLNGFLYVAGFFSVISQQVVRIARGPRTLLALTILTSGVLSALFLNDTIVLMLTPLILDLTRALKRNPLPYLLGVATAANVGSVATITGNPQNMIIGSASGMSYLEFSAALLPTALIGLGICWLVICLIYRREFRAEHFVVPEVSRSTVYLPLLKKSAVVLPVMLMLFFLGVPVALASFLAAAAMFATRRIKPERIWKTIDWSLLVFFAGLFVVTGTLEVQGLTNQLFEWLMPIAQSGLVAFGMIAVVLSNLISNVPAVLLLQGLIPAFQETQRAWLMLAAASTLAGNLTLLGSVANLIMAELALRWGVQVRFIDYLKVGLPITILTLIVAFLLI